MLVCRNRALFPLVATTATCPVGTRTLTRFRYFALLRPCFAAWKLEPGKCKEKDVEMELVRQ
jgi:hypothetical protein